MELFEVAVHSIKDESVFIKNVCTHLNTTPHDIHDQLTRDCIAGNFDSPLCRGISSLFRYDCLCGPPSPALHHSVDFLFTKLFAHIVAGPKGLDELTSALKNYDCSARCSLVWTGDYFAYRCRTCGLTPSMSLCGACFTAGNHEGHDFNKFKSMCGGACDCGDVAVIKASGNCRYHRPDKVANRPCPPTTLTAALEFLLPKVLTALIYWFWKNLQSDQLVLSEIKAPMLFFLHRLHSCGWVTQKLMANVLTDPKICSDFFAECSSTLACRSFGTTMIHKTLLDAFLFTSIKLRFPESLNTLLIGLLAVTEFKEQFLNSYVDHYSSMASTLMITAREKNATSEASLQMNNRIVHISVQLFSGEEPALKMVRGRDLHIIIANLMNDMFRNCKTRLDDRGNNVINCDGSLIQNNAFWPLTSDLNNLLSHKSVCDILVEDRRFLSLWTRILESMQFMNCFSMKEGSHVEYETMAFYHGLTMEIEVGITSMWYIWQHYRTRIEKPHCLMYTNACLSTLARQLTYLGRLVTSSTQWAHPIRGPLSLHLPLSRHAACFLCLSVITHRADLEDLMAPFLLPNPTVLRRLMEELGNVLLGCHEVLIGYWVRNGQSIRQSIIHYMQSQLCYSMIDLDIFLFQVCAVLLHPVYILNTLVDQSRLLQNFCFHRELMALTGLPATQRYLDRQPMAIEAWLTNLCWILDLRNNLGLTESELIEKELVCFLAPDSRKRSDLACLLPDRCGLPSNSPEIDKGLETVANFSAPTCDNLSGSLVSGYYFLKPELWHDKFDPVFYSLRISSKRDLASALDKYRNHCRQTGNPQNVMTFWLPYRLPPKLTSTFADLENMLHSRHLHYILFSLLSLYVYGDPLMTEESLAIVVHLLYRAVVAGAEMHKVGESATSLNIAAEPAIPKVDPIECTEAFMAATNREAELEAMQFADTDVDDEEETEGGVFDARQLLAEGEEDGEEGEETAQAAEIAASTAVSMEVDGEEQPEQPVPSTSAEMAGEDSPSFIRGPVLTRVKAFKVRKPPPLLLKWDLSIVACPFPAPEAPQRPKRYAKKKLVCSEDENAGKKGSSQATEEEAKKTSKKTKLPPAPTIFDNMATWLTTSQQTVELAPVETNVTPSGLECSVPTLAASTKGPLTDSILSLLIKTHARLHWNRIVNGVDLQEPNSSMASGGTGLCGVAASQEYPFINFSLQLGSDQVAIDDTPETSIPEMIYDLSARAMVVLKDTNPCETSSSPLARAVQAATTAAAPDISASSKERMVDLLKKMASELRYFAVRAPAYTFTEERDGSSEGGGGEGSPICGDGAFWVSRLLDKICETSGTCARELRAYVERAKDPFGMVNDSATAATDVNHGTAADAEGVVDAGTDSSLMLPGLQSSTQTRAQRKRAASERRKRLLEMMASKQRAFATTFLKDMEIDKLDDDTMENLDTKMEHDYECVICQAVSNTPQPMVLLVMMCESSLMQQMRNYPDEPQLIGERMFYTQSNLAEGRTYVRPLPTHPPEVRTRLALSKPHPTSSLLAARTISDTDDCSSSVGVAPRRPPTATLIMTPCELPALGISPHFLNAAATDPTTGAVTDVSMTRPNAFGSGVAPVCYAESRKWWQLALPFSVSSVLPLLRPGVLLQTCGHAVHRECFLRYRNQTIHHGGVSAARWWANCPLCRRDVHYLLPLHRIKELDCTTSPAPANKTASASEAAPASVTANSAITGCGYRSFFRCLRDNLAALPRNPPSFWSNMVGYDEDDPHHRRSVLSNLIGRDSEVTIILRSQFEMELSVLMICPSQYPNVARRCLFQETMNYLRHVYRTPSDLLDLVDSMALCFIPSHKNRDSEESPQSLPDLEVPSTFGLCNDPTDVLMTLLPHVWPSQDQFMALASACLCMSYTRALVGLVLGQVDALPRVANQRASIHCARERMKHATTSGVAACARNSAMLGGWLAETGCYIIRGNLTSFNSTCGCRHDHLFGFQIPSPMKSNILAVISCLDNLLDRLLMFCPKNTTVSGAPTPSFPAAASSSADPGMPAGVAVTFSSMLDYFSSHHSTSTGPSLAEGGGCGVAALQVAANLDILQLHCPAGDSDAMGRDLHDYVMARVLPCLRLVALVYARWQDSFHVHDTNGTGPAVAMSLPFVGNLSAPTSIAAPVENKLSKEFMALTAFLGMGGPLGGYKADGGGSWEDDDPMLGVGPLLPFVQTAALRSGLTESIDGPAALDELIHRWINQISSTFSPPLEPSKSSLSLAATGGPGCSPTVTAAAVASSAVQQSSSAGTTDASLPIPPPAPPLNQALRLAHPDANRSLAIPGQLAQTYMRDGAASWLRPTPNDWIIHLGPLMSLGRQLYPPRLIRPPRAFDDLFNGLHLVTSAADRHPFQDNILCLVCGELFCARCPPQLPQLLYEHAYRCEGFAGVALEINTSLVHVSLGTSTCDWGSIYLDAYGEEDLDLKRGKSLFFNDERFALLENQWLTHSFRHVLKQWRYH